MISDYTELMIAWCYSILFHLFRCIWHTRISIHVSFSAPKQKNNNFEKYGVMIRKNTKEKKKFFLFFVSTHSNGNNSRGSGINSTQSYQTTTFYYRQASLVHHHFFSISRTEIQEIGTFHVKLLRYKCAPPSHTKIKSVVRFLFHSHWAVIQSVSPNKYYVCKMSSCSLAKKKKNQIK